MTNCKRFEVWLADLSPQFGTEPGKTRPVLVIQSDLLNQIHPSTIICPLTTKINKEVSILRVNLRKGEAGLQKPSAIMIDQLRAIDNRRFTKRLGEISPASQAAVENNISIILDLNWL